MMTMTMMMMMMTMTDSEKVVSGMMMTDECWSSRRCEREKRREVG